LGIEKPENLIIRRLAVAPPCVRPSVSMGSNMRSEDDLTYSYQAIIKNNNFLRDQIDKGTNATTVNELVTVL
jgi:DNA-directed RNA polymerase beta' subunit